MLPISFQILCNKTYKQFSDKSKAALLEHDQCKRDQGRPDGFFVKIEYNAHFLIFAITSHSIVYH